MHIPEHVIEEVRHRSDIVEVIGEHVRLQKRGKNFLGLCPFHSEKTPSFNVNPELGIYKCFGCGKSGSVINFVMDHDALSFPESVRFLARRIGMVIEDEQQTDAERQEHTRTDAAHKVLAAACEYYEEQLRGPAGKVAWKYLSGRGFDESTIRGFHCGYAPDDWQSTSVELMRRGFSEQTMEDAGLIIRRDDGGMYDRFRGRIMFPIHDSMGRAVGFGARVLLGDSGGAKYVNSPQSRVYDKSRIVYGLFQAKQEIRKQDRVILTEGYADTITLHQSGFTNAVASSGTALTAEQLKLIARYSKNLVVAYDGDDAGINAAMKAIELAIPLGFDVSVVSLPDKEDPDTFVRSRGADAFTRHLREAQSFIDFLAERYKVQGQLATPKGTAEAVRSLVKLVATIDDALQREFLLRQVSARFAMREEMLYAEMSHIKGTSASHAYKPSGSTSQRPVPTPASPLMRQSHGSLTSEERSLVLCGLRSEEALRIMDTEFGISEQMFTSDVARNIFSALMHAQHNGLERTTVVTDPGVLSEEERAIVSEMLFTDRQPSEGWTRFSVELHQTDVRLVIADAVLRIRLRVVLRELGDVKDAIQRDESIELLQRFQDLTRQRQDLESEMRRIDRREAESDE